MAGSESENSTPSGGIKADGDRAETGEAQEQDASRWTRGASA